MKNTYSFIKVLSVLFLLSGFSFMFTEKYFLSVLAIASFVIIVFIDSDWFFDRVKISNPNSIVIFITFILLIINGYYIFNEMTLSSIKITTEQQKAYDTYNTEIYTAFYPCMNLHNDLMTKIHTEGAAAPDEVKSANSACFDSVAAINKLELKGDFPKSIIKLVEQNKIELKKVAVNLSSYKYSSTDTQELLINRVKTSLDIYGKNITKMKSIINSGGENNPEYRIMVKI